MKPLKRDLDALSSTEFDVCIVGGGITGLCVAHDAASRGLKVALLERGDFAQGTSSASTKLIHGGTRYLEHAEFGLVREALRERRLLLRIAPHLTRPIPFMIPFYDDSPVSASLVRLGMLVYDGLSYDKNWGTLQDKQFAWHTFLSPKRALDLEPELRQDGLKGASAYFDGQAVNPMRICVEIARTAGASGAQLANYAQVTAIRVESRRVVGVEALDRLQGRSFTVRSKLTVNCAGIWAVEVMKLLGPPPVRLKPSKGIHVVTRPISRIHAVVSISKTGRRIMVIPWRGHSLIGTTDDFYDGDIDRIRATADEAQVLLDEVNAFIPSAALKPADIVASYAGARPLIFRPGRSASDLSRAWRIIDHAKNSGVAGLLSILGGKFTTSRGLAETVTDLLMKRLGRKGSCATDALPIGGGDVGVVNEYLERQRPAAAGLVDDECLEELVHSYGSGWVEVLDYVKRDRRLAERIAPDRPFILAQVHHAVERELAFTVSDVALRRTDAGNLGDASLAVGRRIAAELKGLLKKTDAELERQLDEYRDQISLEDSTGRH